MRNTSEERFDSIREKPLSGNQVLSIHASSKNPNKLRLYCGSILFGGSENMADEIEATKVTDLFSNISTYEDFVRLSSSTRAQILELLEKKRAEEEKGKSESEGPSQS